VDYKAEAQALVQNLSQRMGPSPYDIAWLARLPAEINASQARWPDLLDWLLEHQHPDGSWGGAVAYYHDRVICTLAAGIALRIHGHAPEAVRRAERYLWKNLLMLQQDHFELVGFELIFPTLLNTAQACGLDVPSNTCGYGQIQTAKLKLIPPERLYSPHVSVVHSLEFLGRSVDVNRLQGAIASNGSLGNSPAATAYYLLRNPTDSRAWAYLEGLRTARDHITYLYPFRTFELTWVLNNLAFCGLPITDLVGPEVWEGLRSELGENGLGLDPTFGIPNGDITAVSIQLLIQAGYDIDPLVLTRFEDKRKRIFRTFDYERNASVGTNAHALKALHLLPDYPARREAQEQIVLLLIDGRTYDTYWVDKWHISPYYATAHVLVTLLQGDYYMPYFCQPAMEWFLHTQHDDGSWGFFQDGTAEETAYALTALLYYHRHKPVNPEILHQAAAYLARTYQGTQSKYPELWIGKCLYGPDDVVRSAILSALILYEETFGRGP
jgi:halimadienyl-diphosphate synthase